MGPAWDIWLKGNAARTVACPAGQAGGQTDGVRVTVWAEPIVLASTVSDKRDRKSHH